MSRIGFQNGVEAARLRMKKLDPAGFKPDGSGAWDKFFRTISHLVIEHDQQFPPTPAPPPPPTYKKVAPRVAYKAGGSDARYCLKDFPTLRDEVASYDANGLCLGGRSDGSPADCPTSALEIDGREYCSLPTMGDPTKNTGSWKV